MNRYALQGRNNALALYGVKLSANGDGSPEPTFDPKDAPTNEKKDPRPSQHENIAVHETPPSTNGPIEGGRIDG